MAPSPAAGKASSATSNPPKTPTKAGKNPASSATSKLGQSQSVADSPKGAAKSATDAPKQAAKGPAEKAKSSAPSEKSETRSPKLPPRPKGDAAGAASKAKDAAPSKPSKTEQPVEEAKEAGEEVQGKAEDVKDDSKGKTEDAKDNAENVKEDVKPEIDLKDNDPAEEADNEDTDAPVGKVSQGGNDTGAEEESSAEGELEKAAPEPVDDEEDETGDAEDGPEAAETSVPSEAKEKAGKATDSKKKAGDAKDKISGAAGGLAGEANDTSSKSAKGDLNGSVKNVGDGAEDAKGEVEETAEDTKDDAEDAAGGAKADAEDATDDVEEAADDAKADAEDAAEDVEDDAEDVADDAENDGQAVVPEDAEDAVNGTKNAAEDATEDVEDQADDAVDGVEDAADDGLPDLSALKGLEVSEGGKILGADGEQIGQLDEGDPEDLIGKTIGDDGEILDEDGDVIGRASVLPDKAKEVADQTAEDLPEIGVLDGLEVGEDGNILGSDGTPLGKIVEGDPKDLVGLKLNDKGEIVDEDGDVIGRAEVVPGEASKKVDDEADDLANGAPDIDALQGQKVGEDGQIAGDDGEPLGKIVEGDLEDVVGQPVNEKGEILDDEGDVIGKAKIIAPDAEDKLDDGVPQELKDELNPNVSILDGRKVNKKGNILDDEGEVIGKLTEDSDLKQCIGKKPNEEGEILNAKGDVVGKVEIVIGEAAEELMKDLHPEIVEKIEKAAEEAATKAATPDLSILEGLKVNKKGEVLNEDGELIGKLVDGEIKDVSGKKINEKGEVVDKEGNVIGKVEVIPQAVQEAKEDTEEAKQDAEGAADDAEGAAKDAEGAAEGAEGAVDDAKGAAEDAEGAAEGAEGAVAEAQGAAEEAKDILPDISVLEGLKVNKKGEVVNEDGDPIARISEGELSDLVGQKINDNGEVLDSEGNVIGKVELIPQEPEGDQPEDDAGEELPPLSILEGLTCNKSGKIVNADGKPLGELIEGDAKKLSKIGVQADAEGLFWDDKGHVIGRAQTLPQKDDEEDAPFAGLEGLIVVKDGFVEDINENKVGVIVEGDPKKLVGRAVDEDGDVLDKRGNVVGHADRYEEPEPEAEKFDLSILKGLTVNKQGNVVGPEGIPIARLVEGNAKELSGKKLDDEGQIWNDEGKVIGRVELIPEKERESKAEGPFAGLEGLVVVKDGKVEDEDGNVVGQIVEGDPKKLIGRAVDEDGDIVDKYGNVKGRAEPYEEPEEVVSDLSVLKGLTVNKQGNVIGPEGIPIGRLIEGNPKELAGKKLDEEGQIWNDSGKVIGRAELIPENERESKAEGPFAGLEGLVVVKDGKVEDEDGNVVGQIVEGDPKKLIGRAVDEDGDIVDKYGNVKGRAEPYEEPEEVVSDLSVLKGLTVNKQGNVIGPEGIPIGRLIEGNPKELAGKKLDEEGQIWNDSGKVIGRAELIPENERESKAEGPFAGLEGLVVVKDGKVEDEDGNVVGQIVEGDPKKLIGRAVDEDGDIVDKYGNVKGRAEPYEEPEEVVSDLSVLKGLTVNKQGNVIGPEGIPIGRLIEGNPKELAGKKLDEEGQIWNDSGKVIGRAELIPDNERESRAEGPFAGLEGLVVVKDGKVEDEDGNVVGQLVEGDPKKLIGRAVDEDGDIIDKYGNVKGRAEPYEEPEAVKADLSVLKGLTVNKQGNVIGPAGVPIGRLVEGNPKELAGKRVGEEGQIWNDEGRVCGRCEIIPDNEREAKPEGPFAGLQGVVVVKDGLVEDEDGNTVGKVVEGDAKKLVGRAVDEDGDIIDKYGNVKGHAEPYEEPAEEEVDLSSLEGKVVNKAGNVVDDHGKLYGRIVSGNPEDLAGRKVDGKGQIWSDNGKVIGQAELIPGGDSGKADGSFSGFEGLVVVKDGFVQDAAGQVVGKLIEGDPVKLVGRKVDEDGDILDKSGNIIGKAERYSPPEKERKISPMAGRKVNKEGEVRDEDGNVIGKLTQGDLASLVGKEIDDDGYVIDNDGNRVGQCTLIENIKEEEPEEEEEEEEEPEEGPSEEELAAMKKAEEDNELAKKMNSILKQTLDRIEPVCKQIEEVCFTPMKNRNQN